jgi:alkanesulfonate monooxygenase SsuD/methylene tetrahydromethanopterin reductase-like flavin-dependent oxidoreductase (luciferase family)
MTRSIGVLHPDGHDPVAVAESAAGLGYDRFYAGELWGSDAFVELARAGSVDIGLGTAIANVYSRTPATLAQAAATLQRQAEGDVVLGLGTSTPRAVESLHGLSFDRPVRRLHESAELAGLLLRSGSAVEYDGEVVGADGAPGFDVDVPVYTAALGAAARRATGRVADGWIPHNIPFDRLSAAFETVAAAARERDRDPDDITVAPYVPAAVADDPASAQAALRGHVAYYVGSGAGYRRAVGDVFPEAAAAIAEAWQAGNRDGARAAVTGEMIDSLGVAGTPAAAREQFAAILDRDVIDAPIVVVPRNATDLATQTLEALAPATLDSR